MRNVVRVLRRAEKALKEGHENCGGGADNVFHDALASVRSEIKRLVGFAPDVETAAAALEQSVDVPDITRAALAARLRRL